MTYIYELMLKPLSVLFTKHCNNCVDKCSILVMNKVRLIEIVILRSRCYFIHCNDCYFRNKASRVPRYFFLDVCQMKTKKLYWFIYFYNKQIDLIKINNSVIKDQ